MIRVAIVDDHPIARRGLETLLSEAPDITVTGLAASAAELTATGPPPCDVLLLDLYHDGDDPCLDAITRLRPDMHVLVVSASARPADVINSISAGAAGYVTKHADADMLLSAVRTVASGGFALSAQLADILQARLATTEREPAGPAARDAGLSPREEQTLDLIAKGFTHAQVARRMGISKATVDTYVERIRSKLQVGNKAELTRAALRLESGAEGR
jgi:two-component system nitrate/nitrite response regulator NarL